MNERFKKKALWLTICFCVIIPIVNCLLLQGVYSYFVEGNVAFGKTFEVLLSNFIDFVRNAAVYCGYAVVIYVSFVSDSSDKSGKTDKFGRGKKEDRLFKWIRALSLLIPYISAAAVLFLTLPGAHKVVTYMLIYTALNLSVELVAFALIFFIVGKIKSKGQITELRATVSPKKNPLLKAYMWVCVIYLVVSLVTDVYTTVDLVRSYGWPTNISEIWTLAEPYVEAAVYFLSGYILMIIIATKTEGDYIKCQE